MDYVKYFGNWMYVVKFGGDGAYMYDACEAFCEIMKKFGVVIDGGKDFLFMVVKVGGEVVKMFGMFVMFGYVGVLDIIKMVMSDLKFSGTGKFIFVEFGSKDGK